MNKIKLLFLLFVFTRVLFGQEISKTTLSIGTSIQFNSDILKENRVLNVYLPASYTDSISKKYPIIYLLDGAMDEDFIHITGLVQFCAFDWAPLIPESIVVGIANVDRKRDFTYPTSIAQDKEDFPTTGGSAAFIEFLEKEVKTIVNQEFRVSEQETIIGQSLGGLLLSELLFTKPDLFDTYIIVSPSLWWDNFSLLDKELPVIAPPKKIFIAVGEEGPSMESSAMRLLARLQKLRKRALEKTLVIRYDFMEGYDHSNLLHSAVYKAFKTFNKATQ
ncbi:MAG: alpha/beta hydrolase-fold protein [Gilvibacter sp.]